MLVLTYDHSFAGFLTTVFELYVRFGFGKQTTMPVTIKKQGTTEPDLFSQEHAVTTDDAKAERVLAKLEQAVGEQGVQRLLWAFLSEADGAETCLLGVIAYAIEQPGQRSLSNYAQPHVMQLAKLVKSVSRERHRMLAFVRFEKLRDGLFFARVEPDFNVLPLIAKHFRQRYRDQRWAIFDLKRHYGIYYDLDQVQQIYAADPGLLARPQAHFSEEERQYQLMWQGYFAHVNIDERNNAKMHVQQLPKRYWRYLTEKQFAPGHSP
jgi:probable DNA metabolism protein